MTNSRCLNQHCAKSSLIHSKSPHRFRSDPCTLPNSTLLKIPSLDKILQCEPGLKPYHKFCHPREDDLVIILHSSRSTCLPKPIFIRAGSLAAVDTITSMSAPIGRKIMYDELFAAILMMSMMPFFHIMEITTLARSIYHQASLALLQPRQPVTADLLISAIITSQVRRLLHHRVLEVNLQLNQWPRDAVYARLRLLRWCSTGALLR